MQLEYITPNDEMQIVQERWDGSVEVKASDNTQSKSLKMFMENYNPKYAIRISTKNFGYNEVSKIKSIPLYAVFLLK